ncbi:hypothetical protein D3C78_1139180 [compost metagenome]
MVLRHPWQQQPLGVGEEHVVLTINAVSTDEAWRIEQIAYDDIAHKGIALCRLGIDHDRFYFLRLVPRPHLISQGRRHQRRIQSVRRNISFVARPLQCITQHMHHPDTGRIATIAGGNNVIGARPSRIQRANHGFSDNSTTKGQHPDLHAAAQGHPDPAGVSLSKSTR